MPRLKEIINASDSISTPIIKATLVQSDSITSARIVKSQIEKTTLGEISQYIKEVHTANQSYISIKLDMVCNHASVFIVISTHQQLYMRYQYMEV